MGTSLPHPGPLIRALRERAGWTLDQVATAAGSTAATISRIENQKQRPHPTTAERLAAVFGIEPLLLMSGDVMALQRSPEALERAPPDEAATHGGSGLLRSLPVSSWIDGAGSVRGDLVLDVIARPSGASGELLRKRHAARTLRGDAAVPDEFVEIVGVPPGAELVRVESPIELQDTGRTIFAGDFLVVDRAAAPEPDKLVLAKQADHDPRAPNRDPTSKGAEVRLFRYHQLGKTWALVPIDGGAAVGPGDGWVIVAAVLFWRSP